MWSSLEKFAFGQWFYPLVEERPFLTFGLPREVFIPMAGVAEFTLGFGMLWTPLVRRFSATVLLIIFTAAVYPFGRTDLVGHALIMGVLTLIAADGNPTRSGKHGLIVAVASIPMALIAAAVIVTGAYWGLHDIIYDYTRPTETHPSWDLLTHIPNAEHPHGALHEAVEDLP